MTIGSLFSGIGGLELGLEWAGLGPVLWQVEKEPRCQEVLAKHWPEVARYDDVCAVGAAVLEPVDLICGGFPCQGVSDASRGRGDGIDGKTSGLWSEFRRIVGELGPRWVVVENVDGAARHRWLPRVRAELADLAYASVPFRVRACDVGAPQRGSRIFVAAQADCGSKPVSPVHAEVALVSAVERARRKGWRDCPPRALGLAHGIPRWMVRALGNSVVPQCAEVVGHVIQELNHD